MDFRCSKHLNTVDFLNAYTKKRYALHKTNHVINNVLLIYFAMTAAKYTRFVLNTFNPKYLFRFINYIPKLTKYLRYLKKEIFNLLKTFFALVKQPRFSFWGIKFLFSPSKNMILEGKVCLTLASIYLILFLHRSVPS